MIKKNIPNIITCLRIVLIIVFAIIFLTQGPGIVPGIIFLFIGISDLMDGYIARKYDLVSKLGTALDPLADKLMVITSVICIYVKGRIMLWIPIAFLLKDAFMIVGGIVMMRRLNETLPANIFGKISAALFFVICFFAIVLPKTSYTVYIILNVAFTLSFVLSFSASFVYFILALRKNKKAKGKEIVS